jgi:hypothetical protein
MSIVIWALGKFVCMLTNYFHSFLVSKHAVTTAFETTHPTPPLQAPARWVDGRETDNGQGQGMTDDREQ